MFRHDHTWVSALGAAGLAVAALAGPAAADGEPESYAPAPAAEEGRKLAISFTVGGASEYVFRGVSQTGRYDADGVPEGRGSTPAAQGSIDLSYGIFYAGVWASNVDFGDVPKATAEVDLYAGIKPVWNNITFDLGVIYYAYPQAGQAPNFVDGGADPDYVELKAGYSTTLFQNLAVGTTFFWSPDYYLESGDVFTVESTIGYTLPKVWIFTPTVSGLWGWQTGDSTEGYSVGGRRDDTYNYWNAGVSLAVEKFTFDFRYWDTDIDVNPVAGGTVCAFSELCDGRFVFSAKVTLP